jgi:hypothetical protein
MADTGLKNKELLQELTISGSTVIKSKNEFGVNLFAQEDLKDGVLYGSLTKPKYNEEELKKSVDIVITELIPIELPVLPDTVLRSVYNQATQSILDLTAEIQTLNTTIGELNSKVSGLEAVSESLRVEIDSKDLLIDIANSQLEQSNKKISEITIDLSNAIQRGIAESVERNSLNARNESLKAEIVSLKAAHTAEVEGLNGTIDGLKKQIDILRDQLFGRQGAVLEGQSTSEDFGVLVLNRTIELVEGLLYYAQLNVSNSNPESDRGWLNGPGVQLENFSNVPITITVEYPTTIINPNNSSGRQVSVGDLLITPSPITIQPGQKQTVLFSLKNDNNTKNLNKLYVTRDRAFPGKVIFRSSAGTSLEMPITFRKQNGKNYTGN